MQHFTAKVERSGRVLIPAPVRRRLGLQPGDELLVSVDDQGVRFATRSQVLDRIQRRLRKHIPDGRLLSEELLAERREEARRERR